MRSARALVIATLKHWNRKDIKILKLILNSAWKYYLIIAQYPNIIIRCATIWSNGWEDNYFLFTSSVLFDCINLNITPFFGFAFRSYFSTLLVKHINYYNTTLKLIKPVTYVPVFYKMWQLRCHVVKFPHWRREGLLYNQLPDQSRPYWNS